MASVEEPIFTGNQAGRWAGRRVDRTEVGETEAARLLGENFILYLQFMKNENFEISRILITYNVIEMKILKFLGMLYILYNTFKM